MDSLTKRGQNAETSITFLVFLIAKEVRIHFLTANIQRVFSKSKPFSLIHMLHILYISVLMNYPQS